MTENLSTTRSSTMDTHGKTDIALNSATEGRNLNGVSNCYVFKSRLQEYAQRAGLKTPVYETTKEGPSHQPFFRSTVVVNDVRYNSLTGFLNRKAAEQSAAEVALMELSSSGAADGSVCQPVHETGLCKNLLQEYAQKMNYAIPSYVCTRDEGQEFPYSCTVDIGGIKYIGASAKTKKEAQLKAARTALLAIQMSGSDSTEKPDSNCIYTVIPAKRKVPDSVKSQEILAAATKRKKAKFKRSKWKRQRKLGTKKGRKTDASGGEPSQANGLPPQVLIESKLNANQGEVPAIESEFYNCGTTTNDGRQSDLGTANLGISSMS